MSVYQTIVLFSNLYLQVWLLVLSRWNSGISLDLKNFYSKYLLYLFLCKLKLNPSYLRQNKLIMMVFWTTSKTWPQILDPEKIGPWKPSTRKSLDHEKPVPWKTLALKNLDLKKPVINIELNCMSDFRELYFIKTMRNVIYCLKVRVLIDI